MFSIIGKADRNKSIEELCSERSKNGATHIDLSTCTFVKMIEDTPEPVKKKTLNKS